MLYLEVMREACKGHAEFTESLLTRSDISSTEKLRLMLHFDLTDLFGNELRAHLVVREVLNNGCQTGRALIQPVFLRNFSAVVELIKQGQDNGEFRADLDPAVVAVMLGGTVMMLFQNRDIESHFSMLGGHAEPDAYAEKVYQTIVGGLAPPSNRLNAARSGCKPLFKKPRKRVPR
jgi:TetR/AcrR family transcriptional regulator